MKSFFHPCTQYRQGISLLASGDLPTVERPAIEAHLAACADCRTYYAELQVVTVPLAKWPATLASLEPSLAARNRWAQAIQQARHQRPASSASTFSAWCQDVLWPYRRIWVGLAAAWMLILVGNLSLKEPSPALIPTTSPSAQTITATFKDRQMLLAEVLANHTTPPPPPATEPRKAISPKPRTQRLEISAV